MQYKITVLRDSRKNISLRLDRDGLVVVKVPRLMPQNLITRFIEDHRDWIEKHREKISAKPKIPPHAYVEGEPFPYLGKLYTLTYGSYPQVDIVGDKLSVPRAVRFRVQKEIVAWYRKQAAVYITEYVHKQAQVMNTEYKEIYFSDTSSKWGSCTHDNILQFNWRLVMAPILVLRYVVIHELAHTVEHNHSRAFWTIVARYNPSFRQQIKWLRDNGDSTKVV